MCWAVPAKLTEIRGATGKVALAGITREVGLQLIESPAVGEYVLVHAGFAIQKVDREEAEETLRILDEAFQKANGEA